MEDFYKAGQWAIAHRAGIQKGISMFQRKWRNRRKFKKYSNKNTYKKRSFKKRKNNYHHKRMVRRRIGNNIGTSSCKVTRTGGVVQNITSDTRTLNYAHITKIDNVSPPNAINDRGGRERNVVNVRGFRICMSFKTNSNVGAPMYVNVAVVSPKGNDMCFDTSSEAAWQAELKENFWRGLYGSPRHVDFDNTQSALQFRCNQLNTDKFNVLMHKRMILGPSLKASSTNTVQDSTLPSFKLIDRYIPLKRQLRFAELNVNIPDHPVFLLYWCDLMTASRDDAPLADALTVEQNTITYFREPNY